MLSTRILTAVVLIAFVLAAMFLLPPLAWGAVTLAFIVVAATEWADLAGLGREAWWIFVVGTLVIGLNLLFSPFAGFDGAWPAGIVLAVCGVATVFWLVVAVPWLATRWKPTSPLPLAIAGWIVLVGAWVAIVQLQARSPWLVLAAMAIVWIADTAAYFTGRAFGRRKLAPQVSPGKTWEGAVGGLVAALAMAALSHFWFFRELPLKFILPLAAVMTVVGVFGDLAESALKRGAGAKDAASILPGHGGLLDRLDSLLFNAPLIYYFARFYFHS